MADYAMKVHLNPKGQEIVPHLITAYKVRRFCAQMAASLSMLVLHLNLNVCLVSQGIIVQIILLLLLLFM